MKERDRVKEKVANEIYVGLQKDAPYIPLIDIVNKILEIPELAILSDDQGLPEVGEDYSFERLDEQAKMLKANFKRVI